MSQSAELANFQRYARDLLQWSKRTEGTMREYATFEVKVIEYLNGSGQVVAHARTIDFRTNSVSGLNAERLLESLIETATHAFDLDVVETVEREHLFGAAHSYHVALLCSHLAGHNDDGNMTWISPPSGFASRDNEFLVSTAPKSHSD